MLTTQMFEDMRQYIEIALHLLLDHRFQARLGSIEFKRTTMQNKLYLRFQIGRLHIKYPMRRLQYGMGALMRLFVLIPFNFNTVGPVLSARARYVSTVCLFCDNQSLGAFNIVIPSTCFLEVPRTGWRH